MVTLIFCIVVAITIICIIFKKDDCFDGFTLFIAILCEVIAGGFVGAFGNGMLSLKLYDNLDYYLLESRNNYKLIQQTIDLDIECMLGALSMVRIVKDGEITNGFMRKVFEGRK